MNVLFVKLQKMKFVLLLLDTNIVFYFLWFPIDIRGRIVHVVAADAIPTVKYRSGSRMMGAAAL